MLALGVFVDPNDIAMAADINNLLPQPPRIVWPSPVSVLDDVLAQIETTTKKTKRKSSRLEGTTMLGLVPENEFSMLVRTDEILLH